MSIGRRRSDVFIAPKTDRTSLVSAEDRGGYRVGAGGRHARLIVADGAGTAHLSGLLAELVVTSFLERSLEGAPFAPGDNAGYHQWHRQINAQWRELAEAQTGEQWYARMNLERGSAVAFAAAVIDDDSCWCVAVGDCCVFQIRGSSEPTCVASFPIDSWPAFNSSPDLVRTVLDDISWPRWARLHVDPHDVLVGASDGIAEWVLAAAVQNPEVWRLLAEMTAADFAKLVTEERRLGTMVDDDAIVVRLDRGAER
jgi:Protein phosphatase 2C